MPESTFPFVDAEIERRANQLADTSHRIADRPELGLHETFAARLLTGLLDDVPGVTVDRGIEGLSTAFSARAGEGSLVITFCAEYDALPDIGHGCGHNLIAASSLGAFLSLAPLADELGITVQLLGTPGEENAGGKVVLLERGAFATTHAALMVHPGPQNHGSMSPLACTDVAVGFSGESAHASYAPHRGRNALDALTVMLTAVGLARQQLEPGQQIHGLPTTDFGAPNVIPAHAGSTWMVRAHDLAGMHRVAEVVERCARAGALAADCDCSITVNPLAYSHLEPDADLLDSFEHHAREFRLHGPRFEPPSGSTDMGNVSLAIPTIHPMMKLDGATSGIHTREFALAARGPAGDDFIVRAARLLARVAVEAATRPDVRARLLRRERRIAERPEGGGARP